MEIDTLKRMGVWEEVKRESWMNAPPSTWAFKVKRFPDGPVKKLKARWCCRGDKQIENVDHFDTFAPVGNWTTVRLLLLLTAQSQSASAQVDCTAAFVHAPVDLPPDHDKMTPEQKSKDGAFVKMPKGFS